MAVLMIVAGYMGAVSVVTTVKWFWFLFGMVRTPADNPARQTRPCT
jgi:bacteriorhodopsin